MHRVHFTRFVHMYRANTVYIRTFASNAVTSGHGGKNLNAAREVVAETKYSTTGPVGPETNPEVIESRTTIRRQIDREEGALSGEKNSKTIPDTFLDSDSPSNAKLTGSWSRAGMLTGEYETVNKEEGPYGRKEGVKDDLRYGCVEK